ncbi:MAG TPA: serine/threonine-protein kinase [Myxococcaceae bacterium]|jgi:serine/threonine-protein kinase
MVHLGPDLPQPPAFTFGAHGSDEERAFLQQRLVFFFKTLFALDFGFYVITTLAALLTLEQPWVQVLTAPSTSFHLISVVAAFAAWQTCRGAHRSMSALRWLEALGLLGTLYLAKLDAYSEGDSHSLLLGTTSVLICRAVIVPTSVRRTFWITLAGALPDVGFLALLRAGTPEGFLLPALDALLWSAIAVIMATLTTRVIYGLRQQVRDARKLGQYTLLEQLGAGAMGDVYLASHAMMRRRTAIKLLRAHTDIQGLARFEREVQLTSQLTHPNTIAIYDYGRTHEGLFYYVMEYLEGMDMERLMLAAGPQPPARVIHILRQVCGALEEAHGLGLLHRDIKPANLFLCRRRGVPDMVKVLDFGLVKQLGVEEAGAGVSHVVAGTPHYLAPEAITSPSTVDGRSDLYSLGAVGYALLTGGHVFSGQSAAEICSHHVNSVPEPPEMRLGSELPADLCAIILRCLEKRPEARFANARELRMALDTCADAACWTELDAELWWDRNGDTVEKTLVRRNPLALTGTQTAVRELDGRAAA